MSRAWGVWRLVRSGAATIRCGASGSIARAGSTHVAKCGKNVECSTARRNFFSRAMVDQIVESCCKNAEEQDDPQFKCISTLARQNLTLEDVEACLKDVEAAYSPDDSKLGTIYLRMGQLFDLHGGSPDRLHLCGEMALKVFQEGTMESAMCHHLIATGYHKNDEGEKCVEKLKIVFETIKKNNKEDSALMYAAYFLHGDALSDMGKYEPALNSFLSGISLQEKLLDQSHSKLGDNYRRVAESLTQLARLPEALEFVEKAIKSHKRHFGEHSLAETADRRLLAVIYKGMEDPGKAVGQNMLVRDILVKNDREDEARLIDIGIAVCQIGLKQYEAAASTLKGIFEDPKCTKLIKGLAHVNMAKICVINKDVEEAETHAEKAMGILTKNKSDNMMVAEGFVELASVFESMDDRDGSLELLKDASSIFSSIPGQLNAVAGTESQIGMLYYNMRKLDEALPHLQKAADIFKSVFGDEHVALGCVENQMGVANMELRMFTKAVDHFVKANKIYMKKRGPEHEDTLAVNHNLVIVYSELNRWDRAIFCQQRIVNEVELKGDPKRLEEERKILRKLLHAQEHNTLRH